MANEKNLIPLTERGEAEAARIRRMGQEAQAASRRRTRSLKQAASALLRMDLPPEGGGNVGAAREQLRAFGYPEEAAVQDAVLVSVLNRALRGDVEASRFLRDTAGESPVLRLRQEELKLRREELAFRRTQRGGGGPEQTENNLLAALQGAEEVETDDLPEVE